MIREYTKQINNLLEKINEEHEDNVQSLIGYETSTELCIGGMLCRYGELYKLVLDSESFDEILYSLEQVSYKDKFEAYYDEIKELQQMVVEYIKNDFDFLVGREKLLIYIKEDYIMGVIKERL